MAVALAIVAWVDFDTDQLDTYDKDLLIAAAAAATNSKTKLISTNNSPNYTVYNAPDVHIDIHRHFHSHCPYTMNMTGDYLTLVLCIGLDH